MGIDVIEEGQLKVRVGSETAGGNSGQVVMNDVTLSASRDNTDYSGIGNDTVTAKKFGTPNYEFDTEQILNKAAAQMLHDVVTGVEKETEFLVNGEVIEFRAGECDWSDWEFNASDDGDVTVSISGELRDVQTELLESGEVF